MCLCIYIFVLVHAIRLTHKPKKLIHNHAIELEYGPREQLLVENC